MKKKKQKAGAQNSATNRAKRGPGNPAKIKAFQFQPGQSGNPGGRPKRDEAAEIAKAIFEDNAPEIYKAMLKALQAGNSKAFTALADRGYGKVPQHVSLGGGGEPIAYKLAVRFVRSKDADRID